MVKIFTKLQGAIWGIKNPLFGETKGIDGWILKVFDVKKQFGEPHFMNTKVGPYYVRCDNFSSETNNSFDFYSFFEFPCSKPKIHFLKLTVGEPF